MHNASPFTTPLLTAVTSGTSQAHNVLPYENLTIYLIGTGTISGGTLIIEEATYQDGLSSMGATWSAVTAANPLDCTEVTGGAQMAYQLPIGVYHYVRARIGTSISGGGTITVVLAAN